MEEDLKLSEHFYLREFVGSSTATARGIENIPSKSVIKNLRNLCKQVLEPLRNHYGKAIYISSGYRCPELNQAVGGVAFSQHLTGEAADLVLPSIALGKEWLEWIRQNIRNFDQCILERNRKGLCWLHVSCRPEGQEHMNRRTAFWLVGKR